jgi:hypothetical protein
MLAAAGAAAGAEKTGSARLLRMLKGGDRRSIGLADAVAPSLKARVVPLLKKLTRTGSAAMRSRGRRLLCIFEEESARTA